MDFSHQSTDRTETLVTERKHWWRLCLGGWQEIRPKKSSNFNLSVININSQCGKVWEEVSRPSSLRLWYKKTNKGKLINSTGCCGLGRKRRSSLLAFVLRSSHSGCSCTILPLQVRGSENSAGLLPLQFVSVVMFGCPWKIASIFMYTQTLNISLIKSGERESKKKN